MISASMVLVKSSLASSRASASSGSSFGWSWERELKERKRGRDQDPVIGTPGGTHGGKEGQKRRKVKAKKLQYARVEEDWGEEDDELGSGQCSVVLPPPPVIRRSGEVANPVVWKKRNLMSSNITDYFSPKPKMSRMDRCDGDDWSEEE